MSSLREFMDGLSPGRKRILRLAVLLAVLIPGLLLLDRSGSTVTLEFSLKGRTEGLRSLDAEVALLPDDFLIQRSSMFFSPKSQAPEVSRMTLKLQKGRRYRVVLTLHKEVVAGADARQPEGPEDIEAKATAKHPGNDGPQGAPSGGEGNAGEIHRGSSATTPPVISENLEHLTREISFDGESSIRLLF